MAAVDRDTGHRKAFGGKFGVLPGWLNAHRASVPEDGSGRAAPPHSFQVERKVRAMSAGGNALVGKPTVPVSGGVIGSTGATSRKGVFLIGGGM